jgi:hypothetical protein
VEQAWDGTLGRASKKKGTFVVNVPSSSDEICRLYRS